MPKRNLILALLLAPALLWLLLLIVLGLRLVLRVTWLPWLLLLFLRLLRIGVERGNGVGRRYPGLDRGIDGTVSEGPQPASMIMGVGQRRNDQRVGIVGPRGLIGARLDFRDGTIFETQRRVDLDCGSRSPCQKPPCSYRACGHARFFPVMSAACAIAAQIRRPFAR